MPVKSEWIRYGEHLGYLAWPDRAATPLPSVVVIQEIWGVDDHIQDVARRIAASGYAALAPELYAEGGARPGPLSAERIAEARAFLATLPPTSFMDPAQREAALAKLPAPQRARIEETHGTLFGQLGKVDRFVPKLVAAARHLRESAPVSRGQKVACVGFCMGGGLSALLACNDPELSGAAIFYGLAPPAELVPRIACPVVGFYAGLDQRVNAGLPAFVEAMRAAGKSFEHRVFDGAMHSFFNDTGPMYEVKAARGAFARLLEFFERTTSP